MTRNIVDLESLITTAVTRIRARESSSLNDKEKKVIRRVTKIVDMFYDIQPMGLENLDNISDRGHLFTMNHLKLLDPLFSGLPVFEYTNQLIYSLAKIEAFTTKGLKGSFMKKGVEFLHSVPIDRTDGMKTLKKVAPLIKDGYNIAFAPEGTRSVSGRFLEFEKAGLTHLNWRGKPEGIIPVYITYELIPKNGEKKKVFVNIGEQFLPSSKKSDILAKELRERMTPLAVTTMDHLISVYLGQLVEKGVDTFDKIYEDMEDLVLRANIQVDEGLYVLDSRLRSVDAVASHVTACLKWFKRKGLITWNNKIKVKKVGTSFKNYLGDKKLNKKGSYDLKDADDIDSKIPDEIKNAGRGYVKYNPIFYMRNNAPEGIEDIVERYLSTRYPTSSEAKPI